MRKYIGIKLIDAEPMSLGEYNNFKRWAIPANENPDKEGYKVKYSDNYISWSPKEIFDSSHLKLTDPEGTRILQEDVDNFILFSQSSKIGDKTTILHTTLKNDFELLESSACVDPDNFNIEIGTQICLDKIRDRVWGYLGFLLQCAKGGMK